MMSKLHPEVTHSILKFTSEAFKSLDTKSLKSSCHNHEPALTRDGNSNIAASELYVELRFLQDFIPKDNIGPVQILIFLKLT